MKRALLLILDSLGVGGAPDAAEYDDEGADTLRHILDTVPDLRLPNLWRLGLGSIINRHPVATPDASHGVMQEVSRGKDSTTGHWEIAGSVVKEPLGLFHRFPPDLVDPIEAEANVRFIGNIPASGTQIIDELGPEHVQTGRPILYTSADSVLQVAAHEEVISLEELYRICKIARKHADRYRIGRVIARPFSGKPGSFHRTAGRHDFSLQPPRTILNALVDARIPVVSVGKIYDLFAGSGITEAHSTKSNAHGMQTVESVWPSMREGLMFVNLVDFDALFGHRRDTLGYANALAEFDAWLGGFLPLMSPDDLLIITADHGNDPTYKGTDHTREQVPVLLRAGRHNCPMPLRSSFSDVAATLAEYLGIDPWPVGESMLHSPGRRDLQSRPGQDEPRSRKPLHPDSRERAPHGADTPRSSV